MKKKVITDTTLANSYIDNFYFYSKLSDININTSIDLIVLSCKCSDFQVLDNELRKYYDVGNKDPWLPEGKFKRKRIYRNGTETIDLLYQYIDSETGYSGPFLLFRLRQPQKQTTELLSSIFMKLGVFPLVKNIELAWDFYSTNKFLLKELLVQHLFLKHQRSPSFFYKDTYYANNVRKSVKGIRVYPRPKDSDYKDFVRLELEIHRPKIKKLGIDFPIQAHHLDLDFRNYFEFRRLDIEKLYKDQVKRNRRRIAQMNGKRKAERNLLKPGLGQILFRQIEEHVRYLSDIPIMKAVEILKSKDYGIKQYSRFHVPIGELNMLVEDAAYTHRFGLV